MGSENHTKLLSCMGVEPPDPSPNGATSNHLTQTFSSGGKVVISVFPRPCDKQVCCLIILCQLSWATSCQIFGQTLFWVFLEGVLFG